MLNSLKKRPVVAGLALTVALVAAAPAPATAGVVKSDGDVFTLPGMMPVEGATVDGRFNHDSANLSVHTDGLIAGNAYTLWSISFSDPDECRFGMADRLCGPGDDGPGPQGFKVQLVGGHIVGASGQLTISGHVDVDNAGGAEYHLIVADHGPKDPSLLPDQIKTPAGGVQIGFLVPEG